MSIKSIIVITFGIICIVIGILLGAKTTTALAPSDMPGMYNGYYQAKDDELFQAIAECESGNDPTAENPHSSATGRFQFIKGTWDWYGQKHWGDDFYKKDRKDWEDNSELAWSLYDYGNGVKHWECYTKHML